MKTILFVGCLALAACQPSTTSPPPQPTDSPAPVTSAPPTATTAPAPTASASSAPEPTASASSAPATSATAAAGSSQCTGAAPGPGYVCLQDCPPPVMRANAPPPGFRWVTADQAASRKRFGCPICLSADTRIATPSGEVRVRDLREGSIVWTLGPAGTRVAAPIVATSRVPVPPTHEMAHVTFDAGRELAVSPGHATCGGPGTVAELAQGVRYDRANVRAAERTPYGGEATFDIRPAGPTGCYWANGVLLGTTLR